MKLTSSYPSTNGPSIHAAQAKKRLIEETDSYTAAKHAMMQHYKVRLLYHENDIANKMKTTLNSASYYYKVSETQ